MTSVPLDIEAVVRQMTPTGESLSTVRGQVQVAGTDGEVLSVQLDPADAPACPEAVAAIRAADWVVVGPGSWFTSVIPHLLVPGLFSALHDTTARRLVVMNLAEQPGETDCLSPQAHLAVLADHAPDLRIDVVLADHAAVGDPSALRAHTARIGATLMLADLAVRDGSARHDPLRLATAYEQVMGAEVRKNRNRT